MNKLNSFEKTTDGKESRFIKISKVIAFFILLLRLIYTNGDFISTKELDIYYERSEPRANGPILFIGGTGGDLRNKPNQLDCPLAEHFEIISYDQRGLGQTSKPPGPYTMQQYADDAANFLNELEIDSILVMGVSFGGMVAQELIKRHKSRVTKLILACTSSVEEDLLILLVRRARTRRKN